MMVISIVTYLVQIIRYHDVNIKIISDERKFLSIFTFYLFVVIAAAAENILILVFDYTIKSQTEILKNGIQ
jgi:hypothetical protein